MTGEDWKYAVTNQRMARIAGNLEELGERQETDFL